MLRNSLVPVVTLLGLSLPAVLTTGLVVEYVFNFPGLGLTYFNAAVNADYPVELGITVIAGMATVVGSLLADLAYALLDPRIKDGRPAVPGPSWQPTGLELLGAPELTPLRPGRDSLAAAFLENRLGVVGGAIIVAVAAFCFGGPLVYHSDQIRANISFTNMPPGPGRPLGTDANGFDILGRLMVGGQSALEIALAVAVVATSFGALWGAVSGLMGGIIDALMMRGPSTS